MPRLSRALRLFRQSNAPQLAPKKWKVHRLPLRMEHLEDRTQPATLTLSNGILTYLAGNNVANDLTVSQSAGTYTFNDTGETIR